MTDPVGGISGTGEANSGGGFSGSGSGQKQQRRKPAAEERDFVEISREAREHFPVKKRKSILELLKGLLGYGCIN